MAFIQVKNLLSKTAGYHRRARRVFTRCGRSPGASGHLARFISRQEGRMLQDILALNRADPSFRESWIQFEPEDELDHALTALEAAPPANFEGLGSRALELDDRLGSFLERAAAMAPTPAVRDAFESLGRRKRDCGKRVAGFLAEVLT